jgi:plastocyanin
MLKKIVVILTIIVIALVVVVTYTAFSKGLVKANPNVTPEPTMTMIDDPENRKLGEETLDDNRIKSNGVTMGDIKQIEITASNFKFEPDSFAVNVGDTVSISFKNTEGFHDFAIDEFKVKSKTIEAGAVEQITFVADKKGTFQFYCSIGQHKAMGMVGTLVVN